MIASDLGTSSPHIQAAEWTFTVASYNSITSTSAAKGIAAAYNAYGIAFNTPQGYLNNVHFRQAIAYLVDYTYMKTTVLSGGEAGTAEPTFLPCTSYGACTTFAGSPAYGFNAKQAWIELADAGLKPSTNCAPGYSASCMKTTVWSVGIGYYGYETTAGAYVSAGTCPAAGASTCQFYPLFYYRNDDPLRNDPSVQLCTSNTDGALAVGLDLHCVGIPGSSAATDVYGPAGLSINCDLGTGATNGHTGTCDGAGDSYDVPNYNPSTGYNLLNGNPVTISGLFNSTAVNGTATASPLDGWGMYTYGWGLSAYYTFPYYFFNSEQTSTDNFVSYYNAQMDYYTNALIFASQPSATCTPTIGSCGAVQAGDEVALLLAQQLPYLGYFYTTELYAVEASGWTGYSNLPAYGPSTETGLFYTSLNVHPSGSTYGGTFNIALHQAADQSGLNPLYHTNWVWQADIWSDIYDTPLTAPAYFTTSVNDFVNWMTVEPTTATSCGTGCSQNLVTYGSIVKPFTGNTPTGVNTFNFGGAANNTGSGPDATAVTPYHIIGGQTVTLTFRNNMTWTDNVPVTAKDYQFSLYAWNIAGDSGTVAPTAYALAPPSGLIASKLETSSGSACSLTAMPPASNACMRIVLYVGSNSVWNLASLIVNVLPWHILDKFVTSALSSTSSKALDLTQPATSTNTNAGSSSYCPITSCHITAYPVWMTYLPNLEVGSGPFYLSKYVLPPSGAGVLTANTNYYRFPWKTVAALAANKHTSTWVFSTPITQFVRTTGSGSSTTTKYQPIYDQTGTYATSGATFTMTIYTKGVGVTGAVALHTYTLTTSGTSGIWKASVAKWTACSAGCEIVVTGHYTFQGLARTWISYSGYTE